MKLTTKQPRESATNGLSRPKRRDFHRVIVLSTNGRLIDTAEVDQVVGTLTGRQRNKALKHANMTQARVFEPEKYQAAVKTYKLSLTQQRAERQGLLIASALKAAKQPPAPIMDQVIRASSSLLLGVDERKAVIALKGVIVSLAKALQLTAPKAKAKKAKAPKTTPSMAEPVLQ